MFQATPFCAAAVGETKKDLIFGLADGVKESVTGRLAGRVLQAAGQAGVLKILR